LQFGSALLSTKKGFRSLDDWESYVRKLPTIEDEMRHLKKPDDYHKAIYILHMPPAGAGLDICRSGEKVGSDAITAFLLKHQPLVSLHGHIHESPEQSRREIAQLGNTVCIQPGNSTFVEIVIDPIRGNILRTKLWPIYPAKN
jgi:Icc-related predicted phosphoesterase